MRHASGFTTRRLSRTLLGSAALSAGLPAHSLLAPAAHASLGGCASEPVALLSNGYALDIAATIDDSYTDVQQVNYTLDIPAGVTLMSWTGTSELGPHDTVTVKSDNSAGSYTVGVTADTLAPAVAVAASTALLNVVQTQVWAGSASRVSHRQLWMNVSG